MKTVTLTTLALSVLALSAIGCTTVPKATTKVAGTASTGGVPVDLGEIKLSAATTAEAQAKANAKKRAIAEAKAQAEAKAHAMAEGDAKANALAMAQSEAKKSAPNSNVVTTTSGQAIKFQESAAGGGAEKAAGSSPFKAIASAMKPKDAVPSLMGKRFSLYLSEKVAFAQYDTESTKLKLENSRVHLGALYSEQRDSVFQGGMSVDAEYFDALRLSFGARAYVALLSTENEDAFAAAFGLEAAYNLPFESLPLEFSASMYYAPDILNFGASDRVVDTQFDFAFPIRDHVSLFAGGRFLQFDTRPEDREVDNRAHVGARWSFK